MNIKFHFSAAIPRIPNWGGVQTPAPPTLIMHRRAVVKEGLRVQPPPPKLWRIFWISPLVSIFSLFTIYWLEIP